MHCTLVHKGLSEPIGIIPSISEKPFGRWRAIHESRRSGVVANLPCRDEEANWAAAGVCHSMQLCVHTTLG